MYHNLGVYDYVRNVYDFSDIVMTRDAQFIILKKKVPNIIRSS
jgi:hypothetical protein